MPIAGNASFDGGIIELFCGAGGFSWGWRRAGFRRLAAIDDDAIATRTHETNFADSTGVTLNRDLAEFSPRALGKFIGLRPRRLLAIAGGPPCQGWSRVG